MSRRGAVANGSGSGMRREAWQLRNLSARKERRRARSTDEFTHDVGDRHGVPKCSLGRAVFTAADENDDKRLDNVAPRLDVPMPQQSVD